MRNVTISVDEETAQWARVEAARRDTSLSRFVSELLERERRADSDYERARRSFMSRPGGMLTHPGERYPTRDELYDR